MQEKITLIFHHTEGVMWQFWVTYVVVGLIILLVLGLYSDEWKDAAWVAVTWPLIVGYLIITLFWGIGSDS